MSNPYLRALSAALAIALPCASIGSAPPSTTGKDARWGGAWGYATSPATRSVRGTLPAGTFRFRLQLSQSGDGLALRFTDPEESVPLQIARVSAARAIDAEGFATDPASDRPVRFAGGDGATIAAGQSMASLPVDFAATSGEDVIVSVTTAAPSTTVAGHAAFPIGFDEGAPSPDGSGFAAQQLRPFLSAVLVRNPPTTCTIIALGDSITEGARGVRVGWHGWPGSLAERLTSEQPARHCGVVNMGISGNRLLRDGRGTAGIARFDRDVASIPGASYLIVLEGINDIWHAGQPGEPPVSAADLIAGYRSLIAAAHAHGLRVIGATLTPGFGSKYLSRDMEEVRQAANTWIRTGGGFDGVIDFEAAVRDAGSPPAMRPQYDSGDHLHPGDLGYAAMAHAVPLSLLHPVP